MRDVAFSGVWFDFFPHQLYRAACIRWKGRESSPRAQGGGGKGVADEEEGGNGCCERIDTSPDGVRRRAQDAAGGALLLGVSFCKAVVTLQECWCIGEGSSKPCLLRCHPFSICPFSFRALTRTDTVCHCTLSSPSALSLVCHHVFDAPAWAARASYCHCIFVSFSLALPYFTAFFSCAEHTHPLISIPIYIYMCVCVYVRPCVFCMLHRSADPFPRYETPSFFSSVFVCVCMCQPVFRHATGAHPCLCVAPGCARTRRLISLFL